MRCAQCRAVLAVSTRRGLSPLRHHLLAYWCVRVCRNLFQRLLCIINFVQVCNMTTCHNSSMCLDVCYNTTISRHRCPSRWKEVNQLCLRVSHGVHDVRRKCVLCGVTFVSDGNTSATRAVVDRLRVLISMEASLSETSHSSLPCLSWHRQLIIAS